MKALCLILLFTLQNTISSQECKQKLKWVPGTLRSVFMSFTNDENCPSWMTTNAFTKRPNGKSDLILPKTVPFAFVCGTCYQASTLSASLSIKNTAGYAAFEPIHSKDGLEHMVTTDVSCLISYGLTSPVMKGGSLKCTLKRGTKTTEEEVRFKVREVPVKEEEEQTVKVKNGKVRIKCSDSEMENKEHIVYVWHAPLDDEAAWMEEGSEVTIASMKREVDFKPTKNEQKIVCSTYDILDPRLVWRTTYTVIGGSEDLAKREWLTEGEHKDKVNEKTSSNFIYTIIGAVMGGFAITCILIFCYLGACKCPNKPKSSSEHETSKGLISPHKDIKLDKPN